jgi:hypothetical protein
VAVLGIVFLGAVRHGDCAEALRRTVWWQLAFMIVMLGASTRLPRRSRPPIDAADQPPAEERVGHLVAQPGTARIRCEHAITVVTAAGSVGLVGRRKLVRPTLR